MLELTWSELLPPLESDVRNDDPAIADSFIKPYHYT